MLSSNQIFDIDKHWVPKSPRALGHWHYDVRYVVVAATCDFVVSDESFALAWRQIADVAADEACDDSMRRMALKWMSISPFYSDVALLFDDESCGLPQQRTEPFG